MTMGASRDLEVPLFFFINFFHTKLLIFGVDCFITENCTLGSWLLQVLKQDKQTNFIKL